MEEYSLYTTSSWTLAEVETSLGQTLQCNFCRARPWRCKYASVFKLNYKWNMYFFWNLPKWTQYRKVINQIPRWISVSTTKHSMIFQTSLTNIVRDLIKICSIFFHLYVYPPLLPTFFFNWEAFDYEWDECFETHAKGQRLGMWG